MRYFNLIVTAVLLLSVSCSNSEEFGQALINAQNLDDAIKYAKKIEKLEEKGLPIFAKVLNELIKDQHRLNNYGKINVCLNSLLNLSKKGIYSQEEAIALLRVIEEQKYIADTLKTADILKQITGVDVGYNEEFVKNYTVKDENKRIQMIQKWKKAIEAKK